MEGPSGFGGRMPRGEGLAKKKRVAGVGQMNGQMNAQGQQMVMMPMQNNMQQMQNGQMPQMMQQSRAGVY